MSTLAVTNLHATATISFMALNPLPHGYRLATAHGRSKSKRCSTTFPSGYLRYKSKLLVRTEAASSTPTKPSAKKHRIIIKVCLKLNPLKNSHKPLEGK